MSATATPPRAPAPPPAAAPPAPPPARPAPAPGRGLRAIFDAGLPGRVAAFAMLAVFASAHWVALLDPAPRGTVVAITAVALATGLALAATALVRDRAVARLARLAILVAGLALALLAVGLPLRLLSSEHWDELGSGVADGLVAAGNVRPWPYGGDDAWLRQTVLLGLGPVVVLAAGAAFWPLRRGVAVARTFGLALLVALFAVATAAAEYDRGVLRGLALFALIAAWLWLPRLRRAEAAAALVVLAAVACLSGFATARVASSEPWVDYRNWSWNESARTVGFKWEHDYGPLDWPRRGTTLLAVRGPEAHYWKAQTLDTFDGTRWRRPGSPTARPTGGVVAPERRGWTERIRFTVRALRSDLVVGAGQVYDLDGDAEGALTLSDGTYLLGETLESGDTYTVSAYVPSPSAREMRAAETVGFEDWQRPYVRLGVRAPAGGERLAEFPLRGTGGADLLPDPRALLAGTPYERVYDLARRLAAGRDTAYDVVKATERYLEREYEYAERVPVRRDPLPAFLFRDRRGYCQQFSGAMALLLRMNGIPTRVASGFTPGTLDSNTGEYRVRDYDAHSWVEVWFAGIGWVPFDPTPIAAPARAQGDSAAASAASGGAADRLIRRDVFAGSSSAGGSEGGGPWGWIALAIGVGLLVPATVLWLRARRPAGALGPDVDYLVGVLVRFGFTVPGGATLLTLEERVGQLAGTGAARYVSQVRSRRFARSGRRAPSPDDRRRFRLALARAAGAGPVRRTAVAISALTFRFGRS